MPLEGILPPPVKSSEDPGEVRRRAPQFHRAACGATNGAGSPGLRSPRLSAHSPHQKETFARMTSDAGACPTAPRFSVPMSPLFSTVVGVCERV